jgi:CRISPR-associated endonuclease/helicase Cas3
MARRFYAHTDPRYPGKQPGVPGIKWQLLKDHLTGVANLAEQFAQIVRLKDKDFSQLARCTGLLHDLGKYREDFQRYLKNEQASGPNTAHAIYGAAASCFKFDSEMISFAIAGHHTGLHNIGDLQEKLLGKKYDAKIRYKKVLSLLKTEIGSGLSCPIPREKEDISSEFMTRMLFSILIDSDRLDTEAWDQSLRLGKPWKRHICLFHARTLLDRLIAAKNEKSAGGSVTELNTLRNDIFEECLRKGKTKQQGFFSLTVPTGGGKTLSSMAFALAHAEQYHLRRVIVVIPYLSVIEQNAREYRKIFGAGQVLEHHSAVEIPNNGDDSEESKQASDAELAMENWDAPIVVTTSIQFIETLFANKTGKARKLHNISQSVVIFDEVQTMPVHLLNPTLDILRELNENYGVSFVFCSATQPAFKKSVNVNRGFSDDEITEIAPKPMELYKKLCRVNYQIEPGEETWDWNVLARNILDYPQILCVLNIRKHAFEVWKTLHALLQEKYSDEEIQESLFHLSSSMCPAHRLNVLGLSKTPSPNNIKARLREGKRCLVISTQLVEAGVDVDFPVVFRAMGPLDSIVQAAGRCNREGKLKDDQGNEMKGKVVVFHPQDDRIPQGIYQTATGITPTYLDADQLATRPDIFPNYFNELYQLRPTDYCRKGNYSIQEDREKLNFKTVAQHAKVIPDETIGVIVPYGAATNIIKGIQKIDHYDHKKMRGYLRRLQRYMVNIRHHQNARYPSDYTKLQQAGALTPLLPDRLEIPVLNKKFYDKDLGVVIGEYAPEDLIV